MPEINIELLKSKKRTNQKVRPYDTSFPEPSIPNVLSSESIQDIPSKASDSTSTIRVPEENTSIVSASNQDLSTIINKLTKENFDLNTKLQSTFVKINDLEKKLANTSIALENINTTMILPKDLEIAKLKQELYTLKTNTSSASLDEASTIETVFFNKDLQSVYVTKTFKAIKTEISLQGSQEVIVTRRKLENDYGVNPAFTTKAIQTLSDHGFIKINNHSERKRTFSILKELPQLN